MLRGEEIYLVLEQLTDETTETVTLKGMEGIGKTWMAQCIMRYAEKENLFDIIIWINVGGSCGGLRLIEKIAENLSLTSISREDEDNSVENLAQKIAKSLEGKRYLLILDDIDWPVHNLFDQLGIPYPDHQNGSKILVTTTCSNDDSGVLFDGLTYADQKNGSNGIGIPVHTPKNDGNVVNWTHHLQPLSFNDTLCLFHEKNIDSNKAENYVQLCKCVPLAIVVISRILRGLKGTLTLNDAFLTGSSISYSQLFELGYQMLPSDFVKDCFLYYAMLIPEGYFIRSDVLVTYWIMEGLLDRFDRLEEAYKEGHNALKVLVDSGMVQRRDDNDDHVSMHRIARKVALCIIKREHGAVMGRIGLDLTEPLQDVTWKDFEKFVLLDSGREFPKISSLLLKGYSNHLVRGNPDVFFQEKQGLRFLALFHMQTKSLPSSLSSLQQIRVLKLRECDSLQDVNHIQGLQALVVLDLSGAKALMEIQDDFFGNMNYIKVLDLSETKLKRLPQSLSNLTDLRRLFLRGCSCLETFPNLEPLGKLEVLDLSGARNLNEVGDDTTFKHVRHLQILNLSGTAIQQLPSLSQLCQLQQLILTGCSNLSILPYMQVLTALKVLNLSGATTLSSVQSLNCLQNLEILDLSKTLVECLPLLPSMLRQLILRDCSKLRLFPNLESLGKLEVLDLSGARNLNEVGDDTIFKHVSHLQILNLSGTAIQQLPSLSQLGWLQKLILTGCSSLSILPDMQDLTAIKVLNLSGATTLRSVQSLDCLQNLEILDLSCTLVECLPLLPSILRQLILRKCSNLRSFLNLEPLTKLEVLDLSGARYLNEVGDGTTFNHARHLQIATLPSFSNPGILRKLLLHNCSLATFPNLKEFTKLDHLDLSNNSGIEKIEEELFNYLQQLQILNLSGTSVQSIPDISKLTNLEMLDLSGTKITKFPYQISGLTCLKRLNLSDLNLDDAWRESSVRLPEEVKWDESILPTGTPCISVNNVYSLQFLNRRAEGLQQFDLSVCASKEQNGYKDQDFRRSNFRNIYYKNRGSHCPPNRILELIGIHGFCSVLEKIQEILNVTEHLSLKNSTFITRLSDLGSENIQSIKECWIERCHRMDCVVGREDDAAGFGSLQKLWVCNVANLRSISRGNVQPWKFKCLKHLHVDCCPSLVTLFSSALQLQNLELLQIKFCDKLEYIFGETVSYEYGLPSLKHLHVDCCPSLVTLFSSALHLQNLESLQIKFCDKLEYIFRETVSGERGLPSLCKLRLWELPLLKSICDGVLPSLLILEVRGCPKLKKPTPGR
ncbi:PREDICTED: putative disease resistance protein At4g19050 [Nelumbo nucifera]|uniref:Disease resistance protein At4g19050 n=1 Tax=Nelumbo nucifera TaxID=4432 RepID=A0A1U8BDC3_NELNU|nr:PREDICTED: putative disease resistance protein At4g19050 [Nelumbo nucifera]XP_010277902.1 PREDICTED: putative disease resistance protein At4g19050 [Nelumbo nucifera]XP_010277903.1 PREDICTED: putative disease resistance protein At4g19050 [Nelumbo nucifera]